jgi:hypothetical protein
MGFYKTILIHPLKETFKTTHYMFFFILPFTLKPMTKLIFPSPNMLLNQPIAFPKPNPFVFVDIQFCTILVISPPITKPFNTLNEPKSVQA